MTWRFLSLFALLAVCALGRPGAAEPPTATLVNSAAVPTEATWDHSQRRHRRHKELVRSEDPRVLFFGDSITEQWQTVGREAWETHFTPLDAANLGIVGDRTQHVLWRLDDGVLRSSHAELIVLLIGTNNIKDRRNTPSETAAGIEQVVKRLRELAPTTRVLLVGILPCGVEADSPERAASESVNELVSSLDDGKRVRYLDAGEALLDTDGTLAERVSPDGLHLSSEGYRRLAQALAPAVDELLGRRDLARSNSR